MRTSLALLLAVACHRPAVDPPITPIPAAEKPLTLDVPRMLVDLERLADDALAGRDSRDPASIGTAAELIASTYRELGVAPVGERYLVPFDLEVGQEPDDRHHLWLEIGGERIAVDEASFASIGFGEHMVAMGDAVFVGREPDGKGVTDRVAVLLAPAGSPGALVPHLRVLAEGGAVAAIVVAAADQPLPTEPLPDAPLPAGVVARDVAARLTIGGQPFDETVRKLADRSTPIAVDRTRASLARRQRARTQSVPNVLATIHGTDLAHEIVMLGAHYDHIGTEETGVFCRDPPGSNDPQDRICNGADDNASGTAMVLAVARAIASAGHRPRRTLVFAHFAGEELGLHGSRALAMQPPNAPPFVDGRIVAMVNLDMLGRLGDKGLEIGCVSTSPAWTPLIERLRPPTLTVQLTPGVNARSDHASFHDQGVPVLFFFTGLHDDYHRTSDERDRINEDGMATIGGMVLALLRELGQGAAVPPAKA